MSPDEVLMCCALNQIVTPFVRRYGRMFAPRNLPKPFRHGRWRACFANSYHMAIRNGLTYVEGYAISDHGTGHLHAWCVNSEGDVFDRTWIDAQAYFGIPFRTAYLKKVILARRRAGDQYYGLLDDWMAGFPLIKSLSESPDLWLAQVGSQM